MTCQQHLSSSSSSNNSDHHVVVHNGHPSRAKIHRDQHQIRHRFLHRLGIDKPSITMGTVRTIPKLSTGSNNNRMVATDSSTAPTTTSGDLHVKFASSPMTTAHEIPSHRDYDEETRRQIWMGTREIEENARRNRREYLADGCNYRRVTEEHQMMKWHNETDDTYELVHPATYWWRYQQEQDRILREEHAHLFPTSSLSSSTSAGVPTIKKSRTAMSLAGMAA